MGLLQYQTGGSKHLSQSESATPENDSAQGVSRMSKWGQTIEN
ncbi:MAG: hypothetical protein WCI51_13005 [Lentisphaerota bacterium]